MDVLESFKNYFTRNKDVFSNLLFIKIWLNHSFFSIEFYVKFTLFIIMWIALKWAGVLVIIFLINFIGRKRQLNPAEYTYHEKHS